MHTVGSVARLAGVSVRTLHHYDELGLLRLGELAAVLERAIATTRQEAETMFEGFDHAEYADEARERWGDGDAYLDSMRRAAAYGEDEWAEIKAQTDANAAEFARLMSDGEPVDSVAARAAVAEHRAHITRWFYPCSPAMQRGLAEMYIAEERFTATYDAVAPGLARYIHDAIVQPSRTRST